MLANTVPSDSQAHSSGGQPPGPVPVAGFPLLLHQAPALQQEVMGPNTVKAAGARHSTCWLRHAAALSILPADSMTWDPPQK